MPQFTLFGIIASAAIDRKELRISAE